MITSPSQGFVALTTVLILSAIFLSVSVSVASTAVSILDSSGAFLERDAAQYASEACIEKSLIELQRTLVYESGEVILFDDASCEVVSVISEGELIRVHAQSTVGTHTYRMRADVSMTRPDISISSFERVTTF